MHLIYKEFNDIFTISKVKDKDNQLKGLLFQDFLIYQILQNKQEFLNQIKLGIPTLFEGCSSLNQIIVQSELNKFSELSDLRITNSTKPKQGLLIDIKLNKSLSDKHHQDLEQSNTKYFNYSLATLYPFEEKLILRILNSPDLINLNVELKDKSKLFISEIDSKVKFNNDAFEGKFFNNLDDITYTCRGEIVTNFNIAKSLLDKQPLIFKINSSRYCNPLSLHPIEDK